MLGVTASRCETRAGVGGGDEGLEVGGKRKSANPRDSRSFVLLNLVLFWL